jgi:hypothetical protein
LRKSIQTPSRYGHIPTAPAMKIPSRNDARKHPGKRRSRGTDVRDYRWELLTKITHHFRKGGLQRHNHSWTHELSCNCDMVYAIKGFQNTDVHCHREEKPWETPLLGTNVHLDNLNQRWTVYNLLSSRGDYSFQDVSQRRPS